MDESGQVDFLVNSDGDNAPRLVCMKYFINLFGDDRNCGTSHKHAWKSIDRVNVSRLEPGDSVWFHAHQTFKGNLFLANSNLLTGDRPITFGSYGDGVATIDAGTSYGFYAKNQANVRITNLNFIGSDQNSDSGICFVNTLTEHRILSNIRIDNVDVSGFRDAGIRIASEPIDGGLCGFSDVKITHANVHDNGDTGITTIGQWHPEERGYAHADIYVGHCAVYRNFGAPNQELHTGNGIVLSQVDGATIEHCEVYENGKLNSYEEGGPVGIWTWDSNRVLIQFNKSHHNKTGSSKDGGGFDLDGGVRNAIVQYNHSHDNDGPGFLLAQFTCAKAFHNNVIRHNLSENDGQKNSYGGIHLWSTGANGGIRNTTIYGNTVRTSKSANGNPSAVDCSSDGIHNIGFYNNIFQSDGIAALIRGKDNPEVLFEGNTHLVG